MNLVGLTSLDYFSLNEEFEQAKLQGKRENEIEEPEKKVYGTEAIVALIKQKRYTPIQALTLLLKNSLEGQFQLDYNGKAISSISNDLIRTERVNDEVKFLYSEILRQIPYHFEGIIQIWRLHKLPELKTEELQKLLYVIAINHWLKYPVSSLSNIETTTLLDGLPLNENELQSLLSRECIIEDAAHKLVYINTIMQTYKTEFEQLLQKRSSKSDVLRQLINKLKLAENPNINTELELNNELMEFIIKERENDMNQHIQNLKLKVRHRSDDQEKSQNTIKVLYRTIAKNCKEINTKQQLDEVDEPLHEFFLSASFAYNYTTNEPGIKELQKNILKQTLTNVLVYRQRIGMPTFFPKENSWIKEMFDKTNKTNSLQKLKYQLDNLCSIENALNNIDFKRKQISDDEMVAYHKGFLENEVQALDNEIVFIDRRIKEIMQSKAL